MLICSHGDLDFSRSSLGSELDGKPLIRKWTSAFWQYYGLYSLIDGHIDIFQVDFFVAIKLKIQNREKWDQ